MPRGLDFDTLRHANLLRLPLFKNAKGEPAHSKEDGSDWSLNDWYTAVAGELGEAGNVLKKVRRGDLSLDEARPALAKELADAQTYLDILAYQCGVDLGDATWDKWNEVSERIGIPLRIKEGLYGPIVSGVSTSGVSMVSKVTVNEAIERAHEAKERFERWKKADIDETEFGGEHSQSSEAEDDWEKEEGA